MTFGLGWHIGPKPDVDEMIKFMKIERIIFY